MRYAYRHTASLIVDHSHLLDGITTSGSPYSAVSSRFNRLRTSRPVGDDAVSRTTSAVGLAEETQRTNINLQLLKNSEPFFATHPRSRKTGFGRTDRTNAHAHELLILAFCKVGLGHNVLGDWG